MGTIGDRVVEEATKTLGQTETPWGSNTGSAFIIAAHQRYGLPPNPWCAMAVGEWYWRAGVSEEDLALIHPYTGFICDRANRRGLRHRGGAVPAGAILIKCGTHVEVVVRDRGNGLLDCIGGNVSHSVKRTVRNKNEWTIYVPPCILKPDPTATVKVPYYSFEDLNLKPKTYGPWRSKKSRDKSLNKLVNNNPDVKSLHRIFRTPEGKYGFEIYGADKKRYKFGAWKSKSARERVIKNYEARNPASKIRRVVEYRYESVKGGASSGAGFTSSSGATTGETVV